jgi:hypothetical protein
LAGETLMGMLVLCTGIGFFYGALTGGTWPALGMAWSAPSSARRPASSST